MAIVDSRETKKQIAKLKYHRQGWETSFNSDDLNNLADDLASGRKKLGQKKDHKGDWSFKKKKLRKNEDGEIVRVQQAIFMDIPSVESAIKVARARFNKAIQAGDKNTAKVYRIRIKELEDLK